MTTTTITTTTARASTAISSPQPIQAFKLYPGDATTVLKDSVATESVDMIFCSPPIGNCVEESRS
ncbi:MAG: hypothetical protein ACJ70W_04635 [Nitrososphaera sp.]